MSEHSDDRSLCVRLGKEVADHAYDIALAQALTVMSSTKNTQERRFTREMIDWFCRDYKKMCADLESGADECKVFESLADLLQSTATLGSLSSRLPSVQHRAKQVHAAAMRGKKAEANCSLTAALRAAICEEASFLGLALSQGEKFAQQVQTGVQRRLRMAVKKLPRPSYPSLGAIRHHVQALQQDKAKTSRTSRMQANS